jgi:5'-nucleotidase
LRSGPTLVISGINNGPNLGDDVIYSGTVAGAAEAAILGVPSMSVSFVEPEGADHERGAEITRTVAQAILAHTLPGGIFLNVNIPSGNNKPVYEVTSLGRRSYREVIVKNIDPRGRPYYWIAGQPEAWRGTESCDFAAIDRGNVSVTPLHLDMTAGQAIEEIGGWRFGA